MFATHLECTKCKTKYDLITLYNCEKCNGILEVKYDYKKIAEKDLSILIPQPGNNLWRYKNLLPVNNAENMISLFEGGTPLIKSKNLSEQLGINNLFFKDESRNPSGAFKDRPISVGVSKALDLGYKKVVTASSGNGAASLATYSAVANLDCFIFIPELTPVGKVSQALANGAHVIKVKGDYSDSYKMAKLASREYGWMNITSTFLNPYTVEGDKTVAYELFRQLGDSVPDYILIPTGAGPLVYGIFKGFKELKNFKLINKLPKMIAVQSKGCMPIVKAFESSTKVKKWGKISTIASAIADPLRDYEKDGDRVIEVINESKGFAVYASDDQIIEAIKLLASREGIFAEPAAAIPVAVLNKINKHAGFSSNDIVVCIITGHGLKDPEASIKNINVPIVDSNLNSLKKVVSNF